MRTYRLTRDADTDLIEIWTYNGEDNIDQADLLLARFANKFALLAENPGLGRMRPDLAANLRSSPTGSYIVYYTEAADGVLIVRVLHGMRDISHLFA